MLLNSRRGHGFEFFTALAIALSVVTAGVIEAAELELVGQGDRLALGETTDVWALGGYAYTGTFGSPCGGTSPDAGVWVWDVSDETAPTKAGVILSPTGSRSNDVRVASMNSGDILVHSNESCDFGPGGFEIYDVNDPEAPVLRASVSIDDPNPLTPSIFGPITDVGVHNLWLFTQGNKDYVGVTAETAYGRFHIYDITVPTSPVLQSFWGAEESFDPGVVASGDFTRNFNAAVWLTDGVGASRNRFLHDVTVSADGTQAYLAHWDAGLILLDISDPTSPQLVSVAIDPVNGSLDGEVNSHAVWPSEDGTIVVESEEDFNAWEGSAPPSNLTLDGSTTPGDPTIPGTAIATDDGDFFESNPTGLTGSTDGSTVAVDGGPTFFANEMATAPGSPTFADTGTIFGNLVWVGRACGLTLGDVLENPLTPGDIAVVRRGDCEFDEKAQTVAAAGASAMIVANNLLILSTPWGGLRIWDYTDPSNPVLASTFDTVCSASTAPSTDCDPSGTYSVHNVVVETVGSQVLTYVSWYWDGMLVLDVTNPYNPIEVARYFDNSPAFLASNGGNPHHFWGVYKEAGSPFIYGSDRNGGLRIFELTGLGEIEIDIKPDSDPNPINLMSQGAVPVAILGSSTFDVLDVDPDTLAFGPDGAALAHVRGPHYFDVNDDGFTDLLGHFRTQETGLLVGDTEACLTGELLDTTTFEACDDARIFVGCGIGFELVFVMPPLIWVYSRRRRASH